MEIAKQFGIEPILLLAQIVNFLIILFVLKKLFYKPLVKMLDERRARIAESLKNADEIEQKLAQTEERSTQIIKEAQDQSQQLIENAKEQSEKIIEQAQAESKRATEESIAQAMEQIDAQKLQMKKELESETLALVVAVTQKVLGKNLKSKEREDLTKSALGEITKS